jgi:glycosyltransferase involved in cell wall biosynthesis
MIGTERKIFEDGSAAQARIVSYGTIVDELHVVCFTPPGESFKKLSQNVFAYPTNSRSRLFWIFDALRLSGKLRRVGARVISAQDPFESGLAAYLLSRLLCTKLHLQVHTDFLSPSFGRESILNGVRVALGSWLLPKAECVRVVSERIARSIEYAGIRLKAVPFVLPIRVEKNASHGDPTFLKKKYPKFDKFVLMVGRFEKEKNTMLGLRAFANISRNFPDTALVVVGSGSLAWPLKKEAEQIEISGKVFFEGWQSALADYYASATIFLFTSNYEGYGLALIEAALAHMPIVTTDVGIAREVFDESGAYIVPIGDEKAVSEVLSSALYNTEEREKKASIAHAKALPLHMSEQEYLQKYKMAWEKCV